MIKYSAWTPLRFGKYEGNTLPWIILKGADWFYWAFGKSIFRGRLDEEAAEIARKSCTIKIQKPDPGNWRIEYQFTYDDKFSGFFELLTKNPQQTFPKIPKLARI